jgi:autotransporter-associated beta strand protein
VTTKENSTNSTEFRRFMRNFQRAARWCGLDEAAGAWPENEMPRWRGLDEAAGANEKLGMGGALATPGHALSSRARYLSFRCLPLLAIATLILSGTTHAATQNWNAGVNSNWDTTTVNWSGSVWTNNNDAVFGATGVGTMTIASGGVSANRITFNSPGYTISGGTLTLTGSSAIAANSDATLSTVLAGSNGLSKSGAGSLSLTGNNILTGNTTHNGGVLDLTQGVLYGGGYTGATITVGSGAVLQLAGGGSFGYWGGTGIGALDIGAAALVINGGTVNFTGSEPIWGGNGRDFTIGNLGATFQSSRTGGALSVVGGYTGIVTDNSSLTLAGTSTSGAAFQMAITGTGSLVKNGSGTWTIGGSNTYTGATIVNAGTLVMSGSFATSAVTVAPGATLSISGWQSPGKLTLSGTLAPAAGSTLNFQLGSVEASGNAIQFTGAGAYAAPSGPVGITISAAGSNLGWDQNPSLATGVYNLITGAPGISAESFVINSAPAGYTCTLTANNGTLALNVATPVTTPTMPLGAIAYTGSEFSYQIAPVSNPTGYGATGLPPGVTLNPGTGLISGTPTDVGTYFATITSGNAAGSTSSQLIIVVPPAEGAPPLSTAVPRGCFNNVAESGSYTLVYSLNIPTICNYNSMAPAYSVDTHASIGSFSRVAYYMELQAPNGTLQYVWASMNPFTSNAAQIGVPTSASGVNFKQAVTGMNVVSNVAGVVTGTGLSGNVSFSPLASGSMSISNAGGTLFGFTNWGGSNIANLGIGGPLVSATGYSVKSLQVFVLNSDTTQTVQPVPDNMTLLVNPGKGWTGGGNPASDIGLSDVCNLRFPWSWIEPSEGVFNWGLIDSYITAFSACGLHVGIGVGNSDMSPGWVFQPGTNVQTGSVYTHGAVPAQRPTRENPEGYYTIPASWDDPVYLARMKEFITAFGQRYNTNPTVAYVEVVNSADVFEGIDGPMTSTCWENDYIAPYFAAFPNKQLMYNYSGGPDAAFSDGVSHWSGYQWFTAQGGGLGRNGICSPFSVNASEMLLAYPHGPARLEHAYLPSDEVALGIDPNTGLAYASPGELLMYVLGGRATYVQSHGESQFYPNFCNMLGNLMGYYFTLQQATIPKTIQAGVAFPLSFTWLNNGVAPLYYPCNVAVALLDASNNPVQQQWLTTSNPKGWMPGVSTTENFNVTFPSVPAGCKLALGLFVDQSDAQPTYRIGNQGRTVTGWYVLSGPSVQPATTWTSGSGGSWQTADNWTANSYTNGIDATADFSTLDLTGDAAVTLDGNVTAGTLLFGDIVPSHNWTLGSGTGGTLTLLARTAGGGVITVNNQKTTISAPVVNYCGFSKNGAGTLALTNTDMFNANVNINGGVLDLTQGVLYGTAYVGGSGVGGPITVASGAVLQLAGSNAFGYGANPGIGLLDAGAGTLVINGGTINFTGNGATGGAREFTIGALGATLQSSQSGGVLTISGRYWWTPGIVTDNSSLTLAGNGTGGAVLASYITGTGALIKTGSCTWTLTGSNTYSGPTTVSEGNLNVSGNIASTASVSIASGAQMLVTGQLNATGDIINNGTLIFSGSAQFGAGGTITNNGTIINLSPSLVLPSIVNHGTISSFSGATWINPSGGSWQASGSWAGGIAGNGVDAIANFTTLDLTGDATATLDGNVTVGTLLFGDTAPSNNWILASGTGGTLTLQAGTGMAGITVNNQTTTISAPLVNNVGFAKNGAGTLVLANTEAFTGNVNINGGVLDLTQGELYGAGYTAATITVGTGAVLQLAGNGSFGWGANPGIGLLDIGAAALVINGGTINFTGNSSIGGGNGRDFTIGDLGATFQSSLSGGASVFISGGYTGSVTANSSLTLAGTSTGGAYFGLSISGTGALIKTGSGTWTLTGSNTYSGATTVNSGTLGMSQTNSTSSLAVAAGATLALGGANGSPGPLTLSGTLALSGGSNLNIVLGSSVSDSIQLSGAYSAPVGTVSINLSSNPGGLSAGTYNLITGATGISAANFALGSAPTGYGYALSASNGTLSLTVAPPPSQPTGLNATGSNASVVLGWTASGGAVSYNVKRSTTSGGSYVLIASGVTGTTYTDNSVSNGTTYYYVVSAVNSAGESPNSTQASAMPVSPSPLPFSPWAKSDVGSPALTGSSVYNGGSTFSVTGAGGGLAGKSDACQFAYVTTTSTNFDVIARVTTPATGSTQVGLMVRNGTAVGAKMAAMILKSNGTSYQAQFGTRTATNGSINWVTGTSGLSAPQWLKITRRGTTFTGYVLGSDGVTWDQVGNNTTISNVTTAFCGLVVSSCDTGLRAAGTFDNVSVPGWTAPPVAPDGLTASAASQTQINLSWTAVGGATGYQVWRSNSWGGSYSQIGTPATTSYQDSGLLAGTPYYYMVRATSGSGTSGNSTVATATTPPNPPVITSGLSTTGTPGSAFTYQISGSNNPTSFNAVNLPTGLAVDIGTGLISGTPATAGTTNVTILATNAGGTGSSTLVITVLPPPPAVPEGFTATAGNGQVALAWSTTPGATGYNLKRSAVSGGNYVTILSKTAATSYNDTGLTNWTTCYYVVSALNAGGEGANSSEISAQPQSPPISAAETGASSGIRITGGTGTVIFKASVAGHYYQLQYSDSLAGGTWTDYGTAQPGTGGDLIFAAPYDNMLPRRFYRLLIRQ